MYFLYWVIQTEAAVFQFHPYILLISDTLTFRFLSDLRTEKKVFLYTLVIFSSVFFVLLFPIHNVGPVIFRIASF
jgi:hypothetical protein